MKRLSVFFLSVCLCVASFAKEKRMSFTLKSPDFAAAQEIPKEFSGEGADRSPALEWSAVPKGTKELALIVEDPDAPRPEPFVHWVLYKIPGTMTKLPAGVPTQEKVEAPNALFQGKNSFGNIGYGGPMPPPGHGWHRYFFKLYALDESLSLGPGATKEKLLAAMQGHIIGEADLMGRYKR